MLVPEAQGSSLTKQFMVGPGITWTFSCPPVGTRAWEASTKNDDTLATASDVSNKLFIVSDPVVSHLCPHP